MVWVCSDGSEIMDIWVVAVAAGAGYLAKYWQSSSSKEKEGLIESISGYSFHRQGPLESGISAQHLRDHTFPSRQWKRKHRIEEFLFGRVDLMDSSPSKLDKDLSEGDDRQGFRHENGDRDEVFYTSGELFAFRELGSNGRAKIKKRSRYPRNWNDGYFVKPLNSLESCLAAQMEEFVFISHPPPTMAARPLLVTDGSRVISRASIDFNWKTQRYSGGYEMLQMDCFEDTEKLQWTSQVAETGRLGKMEKPRQKTGRGKNRRLRNSSSQGTQDGMIFFFLGITLGMMSTILANKREVDKLNEMLKQIKNQVQDLQDELETKDLFTVKELKDEGPESCRTPAYSCVCGAANAVPYEHENLELIDRKAEMSNAMSKIEAELEAELERLEINVRTSSSEEIQDYDEVNPDLMPGVAQGDLKLDNIYQHDLGNLSDSSEDAIESSNNQVNDGNYVVSPFELSLRLHKVIESRLMSRIKELETALEHSQRRSCSEESKRVTSKRNFYDEIESTSTNGSLTDSDGGSDIEQPFVMNLSGEALSAYNEAYEEMTRMTITDEETSNEAHEETNPYAKRLFPGSNAEEFDENGERWSNHFNRYKMTRSWEEQESPTWVLNGIDGDEDQEEEDEMGKLLIKQIVEKTRQSSTLVKNVQRMLCSMDDKQL